MYWCNNVSIGNYPNLKTLIFDMRPHSHIGNDALIGTDYNNVEYFKVSPSMTKEIFDNNRFNNLRVLDLFDNNIIKDVSMLPLLNVLYLDDTLDYYGTAKLVKLNCMKWNNEKLQSLRKSNISLAASGYGEGHGF